MCKNSLSSAASTVATSDAEHQNNNMKNERSESGFDSINDGILNSNNIHIPLNIPLPPTREPPQPPIESDYSPQQSPMPCRKFHKQPILNINFIDLTPSPMPSPVLKGKDYSNNHHHQLVANLHLIENQRNNSDESNHENEMKIDELNVLIESSNVRKEGIISEKIRNEELEDLEIKTHPKDRK